MCQIRNGTQYIGTDNLRQQDQAAPNIEGGVALHFDDNGDLAAAATTRAVDESLKICENAGSRRLGESGVNRNPIQSPGRPHQVSPKFYAQK